MKLILFICLSLSLFSSSAQVTNDSARIKNMERDGKMMAKLLIEKNYTAFVKYTYPAIVSMMGSEERMAETIKKSMEQIEEEGFVLVSCSIQNPGKIITAGKELQSTLSQRLEMNTPAGKSVSISTLIGISLNNGESWTFVDSQGKDVKKLQAILPNLSNELIIPARERTLVED